MYFTDRGIEELDDRRGGEEVSLGWLAERLRDFVDQHPESEATIDRLASWLARLDEEAEFAADDDEEEAGDGQAAGSDEAGFDATYDGE
jgi:hypothetical protein